MKKLIVKNFIIRTSIYILIGCMLFNAVFLNIIITACKPVTVLCLLKKPVLPMTDSGKIRLDLGGAIPAELKWTAVNSNGVESYIIDGIDPEWIEASRQWAPYDLKNIKLYITTDEYYGSTFAIKDNAFKSDADMYQDCVFTELEFQKAWDWVEYEEGNAVSFLTAIGDNAFERGAFKVADMSGMQLLTSIGEYAFNDCDSLRVVDLSESGIKTIGNWAFANCTELYSLNLDGCIDVTINKGAFENCTGLTALDFKNSGVVSIGTNAFGACVGLNQIDFGSAPITAIGENAFYNCGIQALDLTGLSSLTEIRAQAFGNCQSLKTVRMGYVPTVSANIFNMCPGLERITFDSEETYERYKSAGTFSALSVILDYDTPANTPIGTPQPDDGGFSPWVILAIIVLAVSAGFAVFVIVRRNRAAVSVNGADKAVAANEQTEHSLNTENGESLPLPSALTRRELEVAQMMLEGKKRKEIADLLFISENTIKTHINNILDKTECRDQLGFVMKYGKK